MSAIHAADGLPIEGDIVVVADESAPETGAGVLYVVGAAAVIDPAVVRLELDGLLQPPRNRPFHWSSEGRNARQGIIDVIADAGVVAIAHVRQVGRRGQLDARGDMIRLLADFTTNEGATHLMIETSDQVTMSRDRAVLLDHHRSDGGVPFAYDWRTKRESLLWIADTVAGATGEWAAGKNSSWFEQLQARGVLTMRYV